MAIAVIIICVLLGLLVQNSGGKILFFSVAVIAFIAWRKKKKPKKQKEKREAIDNMPPLPPRKVPKYKRITVNDFISDPPDEYVAFDLETTGLQPETDRIIEIGAVYVDHGQVIATFSQLINPRMHISAGASALNHITDDMVNNCPTIDSVLPEFCEFIGNASILAAHNAKFDADFLMAAAQECGLALNVKFFDTLALSRAAWPKLKNHKLETVANKINYSINQAHRAGNDAEVLPRLIEAAIRAIKRGEKKKMQNQETVIDHAAAKETDP